MASRRAGHCSCRFHRFQFSTRSEPEPARGSLAEADHHASSLLGAHPGGSPAPSNARRAEAAAFRVALSSPSTRPSRADRADTSRRASAATKAPVPRRGDEPVPLSMPEEDISAGRGWRLPPPSASARDPSGAATATARVAVVAGEFSSSSAVAAAPFPMSRKWFASP